MGCRLLDFNDFDFTPNNVSVARVDFDGAGANGTAIVSWTMPIPAHLQGCFYCSVTCQKESKVGRRPCDYPPPPSLARCGQVSPASLPTIFCYLLDTKNHQMSCMVMLQFLN